jgi:hypothetical protein
MENKNPKRNRKWDFEEMVAMVDIYMRHKNGTNTQTLDEDLKELSIALNKRADMLGIEKGDNFRNLNGMKLIYQNVKGTATSGKEGLPHGSKLMVEVLEFYEKHHREFDIILKHFKDNYSSYLVCITFLSAMLKLKV